MRCAYLIPVVPHHHPHTSPLCHPQPKKTPREVIGLFPQLLIRPPQVSETSAGLMPRYECRPCGKLCQQLLLVERRQCLVREWWCVGPFRTGETCIRPYCKAFGLNSASSEHARDHGPGFSSLRSISPGEGLITWGGLIPFRRLRFSYQCPDFQGREYLFHAR